MFSPDNFKQLFEGQDLVLGVRLRLGWRDGESIMSVSVLIIMERCVCVQDGVGSPQMGIVMYIM